MTSGVLFGGDMPGRWSQPHCRGQGWHVAQASRGGARAAARAAEDSGQMQDQNHQNHQNHQSILICVWWLSLRLQTFCIVLFWTFCKDSKAPNVMPKNKRNHKLGITRCGQGNTDWFSHSWTLACLAQVVRIGLSLAQSGLGVEVGKTVNRRGGACDQDCVVCGFGWFWCFGTFGISESRNFHD